MSASDKAFQLGLAMMEAVRPDGQTWPRTEPQWGVGKSRSRTRADGVCHVPQARGAESTSTRLVANDSRWTRRTPSTRNGPAGGSGTP
jgi:hypothetical protein